jgi:DNA-binding CsgD family transcriptional regulator
VQFCVERDLDNSRLHMSAWLARCHVFLGNWAEAFSLANSVLEAKDIAPVTQFVALLVAGMVRTRRGDPDAGPLLDEALGLAEASGSLYRLGPVRAARAEAAYLRGDRAGTVAEAEAAYELALQQGQRWYAGELAYWRRQGGDPAPPPAAIAPPFAAQLAGDWAAAAAAWDALACPYEAARARAESTDEPALRHALATFDRLGARPAASRLRTRMRALGLRGVPRGPRPATRAHPAGLTAREVEVARLLAAGAANAAIAARLFLSPRTVENHVAAIYAKLGATTRPEAMSAARRLGLLPQSE